MGLLTFSGMDCFVIFYPLYLSVHGKIIRQIIVRKKDTAEFEKSMELLCNNMLLFGHNDYMEFCNSIMETLGQNRGDA